MATDPDPKPTSNPKKRRCTENHSKNYEDDANKGQTTLERSPIMAIIKNSFKDFR